VKHKYDSQAAWYSDLQEAALPSELLDCVRDAAGEGA